MKSSQQQRQMDSRVYTQLSQEETNTHSADCSVREKTHTHTHTQVALLVLMESAGCCRDSAAGFCSSSAVFPSGVCLHVPRPASVCLSVCVLSVQQAEKRTHTHTRTHCGEAGKTEASVRKRQRLLQSEICFMCGRDNRKPNYNSNQM